MQPRPRDPPSAAEVNVLARSPDTLLAHCPLVRRAAPSPGSSIDSRPGRDAAGSAESGTASLSQDTALLGKSSSDFLPPSRTKWRTDRQSECCGAWLMGRCRSVWDRARSEQLGQAAVQWPFRAFESGLCTTGPSAGTLQTAFLTQAVTSQLQLGQEQPILFRQCAEERIDQFAVDKDLRSQRRALHFGGRGGLTAKRMASQLGGAAALELHGRNC